MATTPPRSSSPLAENNKPLLKASKGDPGIVNYSSNSAPSDRGSSARETLKEDTVQDVRYYDSQDYDHYIRKELYNRVFVDFEVFMKSVLHVPHDWKDAWGPAITAVKTNEIFTKFHTQYCQKCEQPGLPEESFYTPFVDTMSAVLDVLSQSQFGGISTATLRCYPVNDPKVLSGGVISRRSLSFDSVAPHHDCRPPKENKLHWTNPLHIIEVRPYNSAIFDGKNIPRLVVDGINPIENHATISESKKRCADGSYMNNQRSSKRLRTHSVIFQERRDSMSVKIEEESKTSSLPALSETETQAGPAIQVHRYLLEMFSDSPLRLHATVCLLDHNRLQFYHANPSVILVSSAINLLKDDGMDKLIAITLASHWLLIEQNGISGTLSKPNVELVRSPNVSQNCRVVQKGKELELATDREQQVFKVTLGDVISSSATVIGRSTVVLKATSDKWPQTDLVIKVSWQDSDRVPEGEFLEKAIEEAGKTDGEWAMKHLPRVFFAREVDFDDDSTHESVEKLFEGAEFASGKYGYERRALHIIIQEELCPLESLSDVKDIGQVFVDVACIHRWLHDVPGILHRDFSPNNIMCRWIEEINAKGKPEKKVYGVLTDYDLSSWTAQLKQDVTRTSQQRTGTPPYMALELLDGSSPTHLYRHDLESLFYVMLLTCCRNTFDSMQRNTLPFRDWFGEPKYHALGSYKRTFFSVGKAIELPSTFKDFYPWLDNLQLQFMNGFVAKSLFIGSQRRRKGHGTLTTTVNQFDEETLGGHISYSSFLEPVRELTGKLGGLVVRYDPTQSQIPASAGETQVDT